MLAVLRSTLYMHVPTTPYPHKPGTNFMASYGGIFERGSREYTLDDFHSLALDKMDRYVCLKKSDVTVPLEGDDVSSSSEEDDDDGDDSDEDEEDGDGELSGEEEAAAPEIKEAEEEAMTEPVGATVRFTLRVVLSWPRRPRFLSVIKQRPSLGSPKIPNVLRRI